MRDPYAVLGVKRDADASEIKSAWRTIAKKIHPDHNRNDPHAAKRFAEAGEAYEVLRDPRKRSRYDLLTQTGKQGATIQQQREAAREAAERRKAAEESARKVMEELARAEAAKARKAQEQQGQASPEKSGPEKSGADKGPVQQQQQQNSQGQSANPDNSGAKDEAKAGNETPEDVINRIFGSQPNGAGGEAGSARGPSPVYETTGEEKSGSASGSANAGRPLPIAAVEAITSFIRRLTGSKADMEKAPDQFAEARITIEDLLKEGWVTVALPEGRELRFRLEGGMTDGQVVRLKGNGFRVPGMARGDALITLRVEPSPLFRVEGHDIHTTLPVPLENAVLGCNAQAQSPTGPVDVVVPAWSGSDQAIRLPGLGLLDGKGGRGDLVVEVRLMLWEKPDAKVTDLMRAMREGLYL